MTLPGLSFSWKNSDSGLIDYDSVKLMAELVANNLYQVPPREKNHPIPHISTYCNTVVWLQVDPEDSADLQHISAHYLFRAWFRKSFPVYDYEQNYRLSVPKVYNRQECHQGL